MASYGWFLWFKNVWSTYIKGSHAYQVTRKIQILKQIIKYWKKSKDSITESSIHKMGQELQNIQQLMLNPLDTSLSIKHHSLEQEGPKSEEELVFTGWQIPIFSNLRNYQKEIKLYVKNHGWNEIWSEDQNCIL